MSDKEKLIALLGEFGIPFAENGLEVIFGDPTSTDGLAPSEKVGGYNGFYTAFEFDEDGKFSKVGAWE